MRGLVEYRHHRKGIGRFRLRLRGGRDRWIRVRVWWRHHRRYRCWLLVRDESHEAARTTRISYLCTQHRSCPRRSSFAVDIYRRYVNPNVDESSVQHNHVLEMEEHNLPGSPFVNSTMSVGLEAAVRKVLIPSLFLSWQRVKRCGCLSAHKG